MAPAWLASAGKRRGFGEESVNVTDRASLFHGRDVREPVVRVVAGERLLERAHHRAGVQRRAIRECEPVAQEERVAQSVGGLRPAGGQSGSDCLLVVEGDKRLVYIAHECLLHRTFAVGPNVERRGLVEESHFEFAAAAQRPNHGVEAAVAAAQSGDAHAGRRAKHGDDDEEYNPGANLACAPVAVLSHGSSIDNPARLSAHPAYKETGIHAICLLLRRQVIAHHQLHQLHQLHQQRKHLRKKRQITHINVPFYGLFSG